MNVNQGAWIRFGVRINRKLFYKWKGRKIPGWKVTTFQPENPRHRHYVTYFCHDLAQVHAMSPEQIETIQTMLNMMKVKE